MLRIFAIAAVLALAVPTLAAAQQHDEHHPVGRPPPHGPAPGPRVVPGPRVIPGGPRVVPGGARVVPGGPRGAQFTYHGHPFDRVHASPFIYPGGWGYQRWGAGMILPGLFLAPAYYYSDWAGLGLPPPDPGFQWVRYGPDLLLVNVETGQVVDAVYGAFY
jgi:hypothetical protein